jgi:hypothetical protein
MGDDKYLWPTKGIYNDTGVLLDFLPQTTTSSKPKDRGRLKMGFLDK